MEVFPFNIIQNRIMEKNKSNNEIFREIYDHKNLSVKKLVLIASTSLFIGFIIGFSPKHFILMKIKNTLSNFKSCPIAYSSLDLEWFFPKIIIKGPSIVGECFNSPTRIYLRDMRLYFTGLGIFPPGIKLGVNLETNTSKLLIYPHLSPFGSKVRIENSTIDTKLIRTLFPKVDYLKGEFDLDFFAAFSAKAMDSGAISLSSKNFILKEKEIQLGALPFNLPKLNFNNFLFNGTLEDKKNFVVEKFIIGDENSPIKLSLKGKITLNQKDITSSSLNLIGDISFSEKFLNEDFSAIKIYLRKANPQNGVYNIKISGTLNALNSPEFF